jgi:hypothetical protein
LTESRGFAPALCDIVVTIDADGSMDPAGIPVLFLTLIETGAVSQSDACDDAGLT